MEKYHPHHRQMMDGKTSVPYTLSLPASDPEPQSHVPVFVLLPLYLIYPTCLNPKMLNYSTCISLTVVSVFVFSFGVDFIGLAPARLPDPLCFHQLAWPGDWCG